MEKQGQKRMDQIVAEVKDRLHSIDIITLACEDRTLTERELFNYAGYYELPEIHHMQKDCVLYVQVNPKPDGYRYDRQIFAGTVTISAKTIESRMDTAIMFDKDKQEMFVGGCSVDMELLRILSTRMAELGFHARHERNVAMHKLVLEKDKQDQLRAIDERMENLWPILDTVDRRQIEQERKNVMHQQIPKLTKRDAEVLKSICLEHASEV